MHRPTATVAELLKGLPGEFVSVVAAIFGDGRSLVGGRGGGCKCGFKRVQALYVDRLAGYHLLLSAAE